MNHRLSGRNEARNTALAGWGNFPRHVSERIGVEAPKAVAQALAGRVGIVARGNGRSYGDAAIGTTATLSMRRLDRMRSFDPASGRLTVESGVLLAEVIDTFLPRGFFPSVVPGTKWVTIGGMIAADVHGKNHHRDGSFGDNLQSFLLVLPGGEAVRCSATENTELFLATIGGMGLTGVIVEATFNLARRTNGWMRQTTSVAENLADGFRLLDATDGTHYSVAWLDCASRGASLGRSLVFTAEHAADVDGRADSAMTLGRRVRLGVPCDMPSWTLNRLSARTFNAAYFSMGKHGGAEPVLVRWDPYFFPLDRVEHWNRLYGRPGLVQHQCVIREAGGHGVVAEIVDRVAQADAVCCLAVLKKMGPSRGMLSFPMTGYTLALDFHASVPAFRLLDEIDRVVVSAGGRLYLAKDGRQSRATFESGYPGLHRFKALREQIEATRQFASRQSQRLGL